MIDKRKQPKPKHWRTREQFIEAERKVRREGQTITPETCGRHPSTVQCEWCYYDYEKRDAAEVDEDLRQQRP